MVEEDNDSDYETEEDSEYEDVSDSSESDSDCSSDCDTKGINVNVIQPGFILTEMAADWFASDAGKAQIAAFPRRRLQPITSLDEPFVFLCSDLSASVTGATFNIDDGHSL